jgi:hypothetical protein
MWVLAPAYVHTVMGWCHHSTVEGVRHRCEFLHKAKKQCVTSVSLKAEATDSLVAGWQQGCSYPARSGSLEDQLPAQDQSQDCMAMYISITSKVKPGLSGR